MMEIIEMFLYGRWYMALGILFACFLMIAFFVQLILLIAYGDKNQKNDTRL